VLFQTIKKPKKIEEEYQSSHHHHLLKLKFGAKTVTDWLTMFNSEQARQLFVVIIILHAHHPRCVSMYLAKYL
jgi:hypothetical protein